jgi:hypothetical protein
MIRFELTLDIDALATLELGEPHQWEGLLYSCFPGSVGIRGKAASFVLDDVPLLWAAHSLHALLTTTVLYQRAGALQPFPDLDIDVGASIVGGEMQLTVRGIEVQEFSGPVVETLGNFGSAYRKMIADLVSARPDIAKNVWFITLMPDAWKLSLGMLYGESGVR